MWGWVGFVLFCPFRATGHLLDCPRPELCGTVTKAGRTNFWPSTLGLAVYHFAGEVCRVFPNCYLTFFCKFLNAPKADTLPKVFSSAIFMAVLLFPVYRGMAASGYLLHRIGTRTRHRDPHPNQDPDEILNWNAPVTYPVVPGFCLYGVRCIVGLLPRLSEARLYRYLTG